ncbi:MAG: DUF4258 domain-containing protein [Acidobacteria bacterium]|nr:DUF4258 domain-containing protein [Acidobacteriota bacterium]
MYEKILYEMRARVRRGRLIITVHGRQEMFNDGLLASDVKNCLLKGRIVERQWDEDFAEFKYLVEGPSNDVEDFIHVAAKLGTEDTVVITVYRVWQL